MKLAGLARQWQWQKSQRVQNCFARVATKAPRFSRSIPLLKSLHCLPIKFRIQFKICTFVFRCLNDGQPSYLSSLFFYRFRKTATIKQHKKAYSTTYQNKSSVLVPFLLPVLLSEFTACTPSCRYKYVLLQTTAQTHFFDLAFPP